MRKLVKAGLVVPMILLLALAAVGLSMAAEEVNGDGTDLNAKKTELNSKDRPADPARTNPRGDRGATVQGATGDSTDSVTADTIDRGRSGNGRAARRGRHTPTRTEAGSVIDEKSWWWWKNDEGGDEDEDEDDDEDVSPSNP